MNDVHKNNHAKNNNFDWLIPHELGDYKFNFGFWEGKQWLINNRIVRIDIRGVSSVRFFETLSSYGFAKRYRSDGSYIFLSIKNNLFTEDHTCSDERFCNSAH